jgi:hypothetical protein
MLATLGLLRELTSQPGFRNPRVIKLCYLKNSPRLVNLEFVRMRNNPRRDVFQLSPRIEITNDTCLAARRA